LTLLPGALTGGHPVVGGRVPFAAVLGHVVGEAIVQSRADGLCAARLHATGLRAARLHAVGLHVISCHKAPCRAGVSVPTGSAITSSSSSHCASSRSSRASAPATSSALFRRAPGAGCSSSQAALLNSLPVFLSALRS